MGLRVKIADTPEEIDACFRLRHRVFVEHEKSVDAEDNQTHIVDRFDGCGTGTILAAIEDGEIVGTVRLTVDSPIGIDMENFYDFRQHMTDADYSIASARYLCVSPEARGQVQTIRALMLMIYWLCVSKGVTHLTATLNVRLVPTLRRVGFKQMADAYSRDGVAFQIAPSMLIISEASDPLLDFVKQQDFIDYIKSFTHEFFRDGENVAAARDTDALACFIVQGGVSIEAEGIASRELGVGDLFCPDHSLARIGGELTVTALGNLELTVMTRSAFNEQMREDPEKAMRFLDLLGERMVELLKRPAD